MQKAHFKAQLTPLLLGALILSSCGGESGTEPSTESTGPVPVASVAVTPNTQTLTSIDATQQFQASAKDAAGATIAGKSFTWSSSSLPVATVNSTGLATAVTNGASTITATVDGVSGNSTLTVAQVLASVEVTWVDCDVAEGLAKREAAAIPARADTVRNPLMSFIEPPLGPSRTEKLLLNRGQYRTTST